MFTFYPIFMSWYYSLFQWSGFTADKYFLGIEPIDAQIGHRRTETAEADAQISPRPRSTNCEHPGFALAAL